MSNGHPIRNLLFYVVDPVDSVVSSHVREFIDALSDEHSWTTSAPEYVYEVDADSSTQEGDEPIVTCGGVLSIHAVGGEWFKELSAQVAAGEFSDVHYLVQRLESLSLLHEYEIELELDGELIGNIEGGTSSKSIRVGLLGEWRKLIASS